MTGHTNAVQAVAFAPDEMYLTSASDNGTISVWGKGVISQEEYYRLRNKLCLECGAKLGFGDKLGGARYCKAHRK
ncbi:hypothetical protein HYR99_07145 [Candidatus Poribacteria bacterium]|nr:hypothetical protein [Candidatus Poribacteria bacterium]